MFKSKRSEPTADYDLYKVIWAFIIVCDNTLWQFCKIKKPSIFILLSIWSFMPFPGKISVLHIRISANRSPNYLGTLSTWESDHAFVVYFFCSILFWTVHFFQVICMSDHSKSLKTASSESEWPLFIPLLHCLLFPEHIFPPTHFFTSI